MKQRGNIDIQQHEQDFAYVDLIITEHTNAAIAKVNAEALQTLYICRQSRGGI